MDKQAEIISLLRSIYANLPEGSSSAEGFYIGTKEERLSLQPKNGYEFNQVEEDGTVHRYFYEKDEWVLSANPAIHDTEQVIIMLSSNTGVIDFTQYKVTVSNITTGDVYSVDIDDTGEGIIYIPIGDEYEVVFPEVENYHTPTSESYVAERYIRQINKRYTYISNGVTYIVEASDDPEVPIEAGSDETCIDRILNCTEDGNPGSYIIDETHKLYARLDPEDHNKFEDGTLWSGTYGNAFRHIGSFYRFWDSTYEGPGSKYTISDTNFNPNAIFCKDKWIGIYKGAVVDSKLVSRPNLVPTRDTTIQDFQSYAQANSLNYGINDYATWVDICHLFMAKYGTRDSQGTIGTGLTRATVDTSATTTLYETATGYTATLGDSSGELTGPTVNSYTYKQCKLFGIEAPWGQNWEFLKGIRFSGSLAYVYDKNEITPTTVGDRTFIRNTSLSSTYLSKMILGEYGDIIGSGLNVAGDSAHHYCDGGWSSDNENLLSVGGASHFGFLAGLFCGSSHHVFSHSGANYGARICFYGDITKYTLVTGAEMKAANS